MRKHTTFVQASLQRRIACGVSLEEAYKRVKSSYQKGENFCQYAIDAYCTEKGNVMKPNQQEHLATLQGNKLAERQMRAEAEKLEAEGWKPEAP